MSDKQPWKEPSPKNIGGVLSTAVALYEHRGNMPRAKRRELGVPRGTFEVNIPARRAKDGSYVPAW